MTSSGVLLYRCRLCGVQETIASVPDLLSAIASLVADGQTPKEWGIVMYMTTPHTCGPGVVGVADLIGGKVHSEPWREEP